MRLFIIFEVTTQGDPEEPLFRQVHWELAETGNGHGVKLSKTWAEEHAKADTLYCTLEVFDSTAERRWGGTHAGSAYYWHTEANVQEAMPSQYGWPFVHPQSEEEGRTA